MGGQGYDRETQSLLGRLFARSDDLDSKFFPNAINSPLRLWLDGFYQGHPFLGGLLRGVVAGTVLFLVLGLFGRFRDPWLLLIFAIAFGVVMTIFTYLYYRGAPRD